MELTEIARQRLSNLALDGPKFERPADVVAALGAVQSQDFAPAKWSIGQRTITSVDIDLDEAYANADIIRTHVLRPTWHFVHPDDLIWLQALTGPRVHAGNASRYRELELDKRLLARTERILRRALQNGNHMTRKEIRELFRSHRIATDTMRLGHILLSAELNATICSGGLQGKQHSYALVEERITDQSPLEEDEALVELIMRYFTSHGPASLKDLRWWCSLPLAELRRGVEVAGDRLQQEIVGGTTYYFVGGASARASRHPRVHLLQTYDEYIVGYTETRAVNNLEGIDTWRLGPAPLFTGSIVLDTQMAGHWRRRMEDNCVIVQASLNAGWTSRQLAALEAAVNDLAAFLGVPEFEVQFEPAGQWG